MVSTLFSDSLIPVLLFYHLGHVEGLGFEDREFIALVQGLLGSGYRPMVICPREGVLAQTLRAQGVEVRAGCPRFWGFWHLPPGVMAEWREFQHRHREWIAYLRQLIDQFKPSLIHCTSLVNALGALVGWECGVPVIWQAREWLEPGVHRRQVLRLVTNLATRVVAGSKKVSEMFREDHGGLRVEHLYPGIAQPAVGGQDRTALRQILGLQPREQVVGFVGNLLPAGGAEDFLHTAAIIHRYWPEAKFLLAGEDRGTGYRRYLKDLIEELGLAEVVVMAPPGRSPELILAVLDILVSCDRRGYLGGNPVPVAMLMAKPVVAYQVGVMEELINDRVGCLEQAGDLTGLARSVLELLVDRGLARRMGERALNHAVELFNMDQVVAAWQQVYWEVRTDHLHRARRVVG